MAPVAKTLRGWKATCHRSYFTSVLHHAVERSAEKSLPLSFSVAVAVAVAVAVVVVVVVVVSFKSSF
jgi:hypothetical protein